jgi:hypothetical protein
MSIQIDKVRHEEPQSAGLKLTSLRKIKENEYENESQIDTIVEK